MISLKSKSKWLLIFIFTLISCTITIGRSPKIQPISVVSQFPEDKKSNLVAIISIVIQDYGYIISVINEETGTITTDWKQEESIWEHSIERTKISVSVSFDKNDFMMTMFRQEYVDGNVWKDTILYDSDKERLDTILNDVKMKIGM